MPASQPWVSPMNGRMSAADFLLISDPLSEEACRSLVGYSKEDRYVDFKVSFDHRLEKSWIDFAVDCAAFANTDGGFIVVGVRDQTWEQLGIDKEAADALRDTKKVIEKINRGDLRPLITGLGTRVFTINEREFAVIHVPASRDVTHVFESNLDWTAPGGRAVRGVPKGAIYVRRSASNQVLTSVDFEELVQRRLMRFREKILDGVVRAVNVAPETQVVTVAKVVGARGEAGVQVVDAPPGSELVGKSLTFAVKSLADKINMYAALVDPANNERVDASLLFEAFARRGEESLAPEQREWIGLYSLLRRAPVFYWLSGFRVADVRRIIEAAFNAGTNLQKAFILNYAAFYGESFYNKLYAKVPPYSARRLTHNKVAVFRTGPSKRRAEDDLRATELALQLSRVVDQTAAYELERLDCALYAPF